MKKNINLFYIISFLKTFVFTTAIWAFFFTIYLNFSFWQALFLITIVWIISTLFEVPFWTWADRFWRKKMYILWTLLLVINLIFWCFATNFWSFIIAWIIAWLWNAIVSWNLEAMIHDWLEDQKNEKEFKNIASNSYIFIFLWRALATSISWLLFIFNPLLPIYLTLISTILILLFAFFLKEPKQILSEHKDNISHLKESIWFLIKYKFILIFMTILWLLSWLWNIYFFTQQPYFKELWFSIEFIWITFTIWALFSALGSFIFKKISDKISDKIILNLLLLMTLVACVLFALFWKIFAIFWLVILSLMFWFIMTFWNNFLIHKVPKNQKSTILSIFSLFITIWYSWINIILSWIIWFLWLYYIYLIIILLVLLLLIFNLLTFNRLQISLKITDKL